MQDLAVIAVTIAFFVIAAAYIAACARLES